MYTNGEVNRNSDKPEFSVLRKKIKSVNLVYVALYFISSFLLVYASASQKRAPLWIGLTDGVIAFLIVGLSFYYIQFLLLHLQLKARSSEGEFGVRGSKFEVRGFQDLRLPFHVCRISLLIKSSSC